MYIVARVSGLRAAVLRDDRSETLRAECDRTAAYVANKSFGLWDRSTDGPSTVLRPRPVPVQVQFSFNPTFRSNRLLRDVTRLRTRSKDVLAESRGHSDVEFDATITLLSSPSLSSFTFPLRPYRRGSPPSAVPRSLCHSDQNATWLISPWLFLWANDVVYFIRRGEKNIVYPLGIWL